MIKAVIFDLGGTLLHNDADEKALFVETVRSVYDDLVGRGFELPEYETFHKRLYRAIKVRAMLLFFSARELKVDKILRQVLRKMKVRLTVEEVNELAVVWWRAYEPHVSFHDDVTATLGRLHGMKLKLALVSNTLWPAWILREALRRRGHSRYFDLMLFSPEVGVRKPCRRIFKRALAELDVKGREAAFVGNCLVEDVRGPQRFKMLTIFKRGAETKRRRTSIKPDHTIDRIAEVPAIIEQVNAS